MSFEDDIRRAQEGFRKDLTKRTRRIALKAFGDVIKETPVKTGVARGNWRVGIGSPTYLYDEGVADKTGGGTIGTMTASVNTLLPGQSVYLSNSCPYIIPLELGHSKQKPNGFVNITIQRLQPLIDRGLL